MICTVAPDLDRTQLTQFVCKCRNRRRGGDFLLFCIHCPEQRVVLEGILPEHSRFFTGFFFGVSNTEKVHTEPNATVNQRLCVLVELLVYVYPASRATISSPYDNERRIFDERIIFHVWLVLVMSQIFSPR